MRKFHFKTVKLCSIIFLTLSTLLYMNFYMSFSISARMVHSEITSNEDMYKINFLQHSTFPQENFTVKGKSEIAYSMTVNTPQKPYPVCGIQDLLRPKLTREKDEPWMIFLIKSAPGNFEKRDVIRRTWGTVSEIRNKRFLTIFLLGRVENEKEDELLREESANYHDLLQCDFIDSYYNLTSKVLSTFRWVLAADVHAKHFSFCDDDVVLHMANVFIYFTELDGQENKRDSLVCGYVKSEEKDNTPHRNKTSKWYISPQVYDSDTYPSFCYGAMWTLSRQIINDIYWAAEQTNVTDFYIDDVFITGVLRYKVSPNNQIPIHEPFLVETHPMELLHYPTGLSSIEKEDVLDQMRKKWLEYNNYLFENYFLVETPNSKIKIKSKEIKYAINNVNYDTSMLKKEWRLIKNAKEKISQ